jgi:hypothetical protein
MRCKHLILLLYCSIIFKANAQTTGLKAYDLEWKSQSKNSGESMPCGGGDIGLNVWVENGELYFYISRSGTFDENNTFLKLGRVGVKLTPNPFGGTGFSQALHLEDGSVVIHGNSGDTNARIKLWVDVFRPVIHVEINSDKPIKTEADYESWRYRDRGSNGLENNENSRKWSKNGVVKTLKDNINFRENSVQFYHQNQDSTVFDATIHEQGLDAVKGEMFNPLKHLIFGGMIKGEGLKPAGTCDGKYESTDFKSWKLQSVKATQHQDIEIYLNTSYTASVSAWQNKLDSAEREAIAHQKTALSATLNWWKQFWQRSFIAIDADKPDTASKQWQVGRNYQLFRYMLGCNAYGSYPTKFNGGLFTYDPENVNNTFNFTPDFRNWGGGLMTAQNQRLVYWPMLKSGDYDMMKSEFDFYMHSLHNAELRSKVYWGHNGACFTEQIENFGLPNMGEYGLKRPAYFDKGVEYNAWLEYTWDTVLEFCQMMMENERYNGSDIHQYIPFIESCLTFFNEHYQYLARQRGVKAFDGEGHLVLFPGSGAETYKMAYNSTSTIAALQTVLTTLLQLPHDYLTDSARKNWETMLKRIPPINFREFDGHKTISPALSWERINNIETTQLYPVFPWGIYGVRKPHLDVAINTWKYDTLALKFRSGVGWKQDNIFAARLGLTDDAAKLTLFKLKDSGRRFPAFWGPGFDWTPDHNWGGSGMIGLQEMLLQTNGRQIYIFPAWPKDWNVHFRLHAPYNTTVEATLRDGKVTSLSVLPKEREKDVVIMNQ